VRSPLYYNIYYNIRGGVIIRCGPIEAREIFGWYPSYIGTRTVKIYYTYCGGTDIWSYSWAVVYLPNCRSDTPPNPLADSSHAQRSRVVENIIVLYIVIQYHGNYTVPSENCFNVTAKTNGTHVKRLNLILHCSYCYIIYYYIALRRSSDVQLCCCGIWHLFSSNERPTPKVVRSKENHMFVLYFYDQIGLAEL